MYKTQRLISSVFLRSAFRGIGQIMLQENSVSGILFLIGISLGSLMMGLGVLLATVVGTTTAYLSKYKISDIEKGLYGFSPALVGVATMLFLKNTIVAWIIIIFGSIVAAMLQHFFLKRNIPVFTLPFVLVTWLIIYLPMALFPTLLLDPPILSPSKIDNYLFFIKAYGQVIFQSSIWSGLLFIAGVFVNSRIMGVYGLIGAAVAGLLGYCFVETEIIANGLLSYNAVLCAIVFAGRKRQDIGWMFLSVILSVFFTLLMFKLNIVVLTLPFVLGAVCTLFIKKNWATMTLKVKRKSHK